MTLVVAPPDIEGDVLARLHAAAGVIALAESIGWRIQSPYPCLRVLRVGGTADQLLRVDTALIQLEAWGDPIDKSSAQRVVLSRLLAVADATLMNMAGAVTATAVYTQVRIVNRGQWAPDDSTEQQRYFSRLTVAAHAV